MSLIPKALSDFVTERDLPLQQVHLWTIWVVSRGNVNVALGHIQSFEENARLVVSQQVNSLARLREAQQKAAAEQVTSSSLSAALNKTRARVEVSATQAKKDLWS